MQQFIRNISLTVSGGGGVLDFSRLRVTFVVEQSNTQRPNVAEISVYNVKRETANRFIGKQFTDVTLTAGYESNSGVIFKGNIKFARFGQETPVDKRLDIFCGDGDKAYNHAVVSRTLPSGHTYRDQVEAAFAPMKEMGVRLGYICPLPSIKMNGPRVLFGNSREILRRLAAATGTQWSIQNGELTIVEKNKSLPNGPLTLNSETGLIGLPTQTPGGIVVRSLLDPRMGPNKLIRLDNASIQRATPDLTIAGPVSEARLPSIAADGVYKVIVLNRIGDTHGGPAAPWFNDMTCLAADGSGFTPENLLQYVPR
ncbi:phage protein [Methylorubrum thiocyanatum]|uniref:phage protein n=1 Tax=Methylorubrum thiocyanatum TaxID=47958 RepID=UPI00383BD3DF